MYNSFVMIICYAWFKVVLLSYIVDGVLSDHSN